MKTQRFEVLSQSEVERIHAASVDLDQALNARTVKGALGPLAYRLMKKFT